MRRSRIAVVVVVLALAAWWGIARLRGGGDQALGSPASTRRGAGGTGSAAAALHVRDVRIPRGVPRSGDGVTIAGHVIDIAQHQPVGRVEVVFRGATGENTTTTESDGSYAIRLAAGTYRAFVRDDTVLSIGRPDPVRLPSLPSAETAGVPDEALMATVVAAGDTDDVDLSVVRGGVVAGHVVDRSGRAVAGAVLRARSGGARPTLATDVAETDSAGAFELRLPAGAFDLDVSHPRFAGVANTADARIAVRAGEHRQTTITLTAGCMIAGRVVERDGSPAGDGALERQWGETAFEYAPAGRVEPDGTFRWVTTEEADVVLRAWPWKAPPSPGRHFSCRDGARFDDVVFELPDRRPDLSGVLVDKAGEPVAFAFLDIAPIDRGAIAQQERTDASGRWEVHSMPPGRYRITAQAEGRGVAIARVVAPRDDVRLELGGTGRLDGTTSQLASGSFELVIGTCVDDTGLFPLPQSRRLVSVTGGQFSVDGLPACELSFGVVWHGRLSSQHVAIPSGGTAHVEIDVGAPRAKRVHGVVRDGTGALQPGALVSASDGDDQTTRTDADGAYLLRTVSGAIVRATADERTGSAQVGAANVDDEQVDIVIGGDVK